MTTRLHRYTDAHVRMRGTAIKGRGHEKVTYWYPQRAHEADGGGLGAALHHHDGLRGDAGVILRQQQLRVATLDRSTHTDQEPEPEPFSVQELLGSIQSTPSCPAFPPSSDHRDLCHLFS